MDAIVHKIKPYLFAFLVSISFCCLISISTSNIFVFVCAFICFLIFFLKSNIKTSGYTIVLSVILSFFIILGKYLVYSEESSGLELVLKIVLTPIGTHVFFNRFFALIFDLIDAIKTEPVNISWRKLLLIGFLIIFACCLPLCIAEYPGIYTPDTITQISQARGLFPYNNMNPLLHTFFLKVVYDFFLLFIKDISLCSFFVGLVQTIINSLIFSYVSVYVYRKTNSKLLYILTILFFSLLSFNVFYSITISKDSAYAAFTALFIISIDEFCHNQSKANTIKFVLIGIIYSLLRSNGYYSLVIVLLVLFVLVIKKAVSKKVLIILIATFMLSTAIMFPGYSYIINSNKPVTSNSSNVSTGYKFRGNFLYVMPFQQVANVVTHERELNEKEQWLIEEYMPLDKVAEVYNPMLVDPLFDYITNHFKPTRGDISNLEYIKLWIELLLKYPQDYLEAYVNMTKYYFYPSRYVNMYYIGIYNNQLGIKESQVVSKEYKTAIENLYNMQKDIPFIGSILTPGVSAFAMFITIFYCLSRKKYISFFCMIPLLANFLILMAFVPINDEFRYIYPIVVCLPIIVSHLLSKERESNEKQYN